MTTEVRKVTISLPAHLVDFADQLAVRVRTSRSQVISQALAAVQAQEEERLAMEGYRFYAGESVEFAQASAPVVAAAIAPLATEAGNGETW